MVKRLAVTLMLVLWGCAWAVCAAAGPSFGKIPLSFVENRGQYDQGVRYAVHGPNASAFFNAESVGLRLGEAANRENSELRISFVDAARGASLSGTHPLPGRVNYLLGRDSARWMKNVRTFSGVVYHGLWPGVDVSYRANGTALKYDVIVAPDGDLSAVKMRYEGQKDIRLTKSGDLIVTNSAGSFREARPRVYQVKDGEKHWVHGSFTLDGDTVGFAVKEYDTSLPLVIDPQSDIVWSTLIGGKGPDCGEAIAVGTDGSVYIAGTTHSVDFPTSEGASDTTLGPDADVFITKLNPSGTGMIYSTFLGGTVDAAGTDTGWDEARGLAVDSEGCAYVSGYSTSTDFPVTEGAYDTTTGGGFAAKLGPSGDTLVYSTFVAGSASAVAADSSGCAYITGHGGSPLLPDDGPLVLKLNDSGTAAVYATIVNGGEGSYGRAIAVDPAGSAYITGYTLSSLFPTTSGAFAVTFRGGRDAFVCKVSPTGSVAYSSYLGGSSDDEGNAIAVDSSGCAYVAGSTRSSDFALCGELAGGSDAFVAKLSADGSALTYSTVFGGSSDDSAEAIALDSHGSAYVAGSTSSNDFPMAGNSADPSYNGGFQDGFVARIGPGKQSLSYSSFVGGKDEDRCAAVAVDENGSIYLTGETWSSDFPTTTGAFDSTYDSGDAFVVKMDPTVTLTVSTWGGGSVTPAVGSHTYRCGSAVGISAAGTAGEIFDHWEGDVADPYSPSTTVLMDRSKSVTALFSSGAPSRIGAMQTLPDDSFVELVGKPVTAVFAGEIYVEEPDRSSGIRVIWPWPTLPAVGTLVRAAGFTATRGVEKVVYAVSGETGAQGFVSPLFLANRSMGGHLDDPVALGFSDAPGIASLYNLGLLVRTSGTVTWFDSSQSVAYVDDGSGLSDGNNLGPDGSEAKGLRVVLPAGLRAPQVGSYVMLTGVSSSETVGGRAVRALRLRTASDITLPSGMTISGRITQGASQVVDQVLESQHPYAAGCEQTWSVTAPAGAVAVRVHFTQMQLESGCDQLFLSDAEGSVRQVFDSDSMRSDFWSDWIEGNTLSLKLVTDYMLNRYGFRIDKYEAKFGGVTPIAGALVTLLPESITTLTDSDGTYSFRGLAGGTYTVVPSQWGATFSPPGRSVTVGDFDYRQGIDFVRN